MSITTLIPAFRLQYCLYAISSAVRQSLKPSLLIISDDSPNGEITDYILSSNLIEKINEQGIAVEVVAGPRMANGMLNVMNLVKCWNARTEFFHILLDDDYIFPTFYKSHFDICKKYKLFGSVSRRWQADAAGHVTGHFKAPLFVENSNTRQRLIDANSLFKSVVPERMNWLGEFSNALLHESILINGQLPSKLDDLPFYGLDDIGVFLNIGKINKLGFINEHLSFFRFHDSQNTHNLASPSILGAHLAWIPIAIYSERCGLITTSEKRYAVERLLRQIDMTYRTTALFDDIHNIFDQTLRISGQVYTFRESEFLDCWNTFAASGRDGRLASFR